MINNIPILRPTYADINLKALASNLTKARSLLAGENTAAKVMLLVKANAYGHGAIGVAQFAQQHKLCDFFGVASIEEGLELRQNNIALPILVLGSIYPFDGFEYALKNNLSITIASVRAANFVAQLAQKLKISACCHIKQETGMSRIGSRRPNAMAILRVLNAAPHVVVEGVFSHLAAADTDYAYTHTQLSYFKEFLTEAKAENLATGLNHIAASSAFLHYPHVAFDMVRLGHLAYGLEDGFEPVLSLKSKVVFIKDVRAGTKISYNGTSTCKTLSKIATIPLGYGDGWHRILSNKASVLIKGVKCPLVGNITMDMLMADITALGDIPVGEEAIFIGSQNGQAITAAQVATLAKTIDYEVLTALTARVPRICNTNV